MIFSDLKMLVPPNFRYNYFQKAGDFPFIADAVDFNLANAAWLIDMSFLAYMQDAGSITKRLEKVNLHNEPKFIGFDNLASSTQCFVAHNDEVIIVTIRGTEIMGEDRFPSAVKDILTDLNISPSETGFGGLVHEGFNRAADEVWQELEAFLNAIQQGRRIWFTGHSLGAAVATLLADRYSNAGGAVSGLYTFGSPRVGDEEFVDNYKPAVFRFVHGRDIVTTVPLVALLKKFPPSPVFYKHVGQIKYIDDAGGITDNDPRTMREIQAVLRDITSGRIASILTQPFVDHAPILYSQKIWDNL